MGDHRALAYLMAFTIPLVATVCFTPIASWVAHKFGILDHPGEKKVHGKATPYLGGLAVGAGLLLVGAFAASASGQLLTILVAAAALMMVGFADDKWSLQPTVKLTVEVFAGLALWLGGVRAGLFGVPVLDMALTVLWVVAITNAVNLIDNMDGLAAGVTVIASLTFFFIAAGNGDYLVGSFALALAGASLGFLRRNFPPARIFLGDAGSLMLGFLLAALALKLDLVGESGPARMVMPALILGVPIFDTLLVIVSRIRAGRPVFVGGTDHSSHRLTEIGFSGRAVAISTYVAQSVMCGVALLLVHVDEEVALTTLALVLILAVVSLAKFLAMAPLRAPGVNAVDAAVEGS